MRAHDLIVSHGRRGTSALMFAADAVFLGLISTLQLIFYTFVLDNNGSFCRLLLLIVSDVAYSATLWERILSKASVNPVLSSRSSAAQVLRTSHSIQIYLRGGRAGSLVLLCGGGVPMLAARNGTRLSSPFVKSWVCVLWNARRPIRACAVFTCEDRWATIYATLMENALHLSTN